MRSSVGRTLLFALSLGVGLPQALPAQISIVNGQAERDTIASRFRLDFAVPDGPAFILSDVEPSNILRPTSVRELSAVASSFTADGALTIPETFAVEAAPALLIGGPTLSLREYQRNPWLYRLRVSVATRRAEESEVPTMIAAGLRATILDEADIRTRSAQIAAITEITEKINDIHVLAAKRRGVPTSATDTIVLSPEERAEVEALNRELRATWANERWNARVLDLAFGVRAAASDPAGEDLVVDRYRGWLTYGEGFGTWGQLLVGGAVGADRDTLSANFDAFGSVSTRFYVGANRYKGFLEAQGRWEASQAPRWLVNAGGEAGIFDGTWVSFSSGVEFDRSTNDAGLASSFAVKLGLPFL